MEREGLATASVSIVKEITAGLCPPRAVFVPWPLGHPFGKAGNLEQQRAVLYDMIELLETAKEPGTLVERDHPW